MAFFYDRNAFWHNYKTPNLRIVLQNNHGGNIFKKIDGPGLLPESDDYFVTQQNLNAKHVCAEFDLEHLQIKNQKQIKNVLKDFFDFNGKAKVLELETSIELNIKIFELLKTKIKDSYEL
jgi:2-succinyl-5-enolpyruvyl-6-hydroxy-3-cyclohexene-1-carboxylate synthase